MDSSDDSFAWTNTSNFSDDSVRKDESNMSESESGKKYKKKLHRKLFEEKTDSEVKLELLNGDLKHEVDNEGDGSRACRTPERKRKHSQNSSVELQYLKKKVKQELSLMQTENDVNFDSEVLSNEISDTELCDEITQISTKKRKLKQKISNKILDSYESENDKSFSTEQQQYENLNDPTEESHNLEVMLKTKKEKKKKKKRNEINSSISIKENNDLEVNRNDKTIMLTQNNNDNNTTQDSESVEKSSNISLVQGHQQSRISDRIQYEDEEQENSLNDITKMHSSKLKKFLKANSYLQAVNCKYSQTAISQDEDIWLLNCPFEVDITALPSVDLTLDSKCKMKVDSQSLVGSIQDENTRIPIVICNGTQPTIKNIMISGIVNFRKRIPKAHYFEDNIIQNNQTDFIPLPETKHRHPLFGADYKKAIKIPTSIENRLNISHFKEISVSVDVKKKRKQKHGFTNESVKEESNDKSKAYQVIEPVSRKRKKSENQDSTDHVQILPKKKRRIKQELGSAESWESERAIEENLFNF